MMIADEIFGIFAARGCSAYFGEGISVTAHSLQAAHFATAAGAPPPLVLAALLHDVGHLVVPVPEQFADWTTDARHEATGAAWLAARFLPEVSEPVRLHVPAKRYLCAVDPCYASKLSDASVITLKLQGGPMSAAEAARFEAEPHHQAALNLRHWDDSGKLVGLKTKGVEHYRDLIEAMASRRRAASQNPMP